MEEYTRLKGISEQAPIVEKEVEELRTTVDLLHNRLRYFLKLFHGIKSEKHISTQNPNQLMLDFGLPVAEAPEIQTQEIAAHTRKISKDKIKPIRAVLPAHLKRVITVIEPAEDVSDMIKIGEEITEILELKVPEVYVECTVRPKYARPEGGVLIAELPPRAIERGNAGAGLIAHLLVGKYVDHLPMFRQQKQFKRWGVELAESTIYDWTAKGVDYLIPVYDRITEKVLSSGYIQADESPIKVLGGSEAKKGSHQGYLWVYHSPPDGILFFDYRKGRDQSGPKELLHSFKGILQTDGYQVYDSISGILDITLSGCMAHARRKFDEAKTNDKKRSGEMLDMFQLLYGVEKQLKGCSDEEILRIRQDKSLPVLTEMHTWMKEQLYQVTPSSLIGKAIQYTMGRWNKLLIYTEHPQLHIDNNAIENAIRPLALGRKNYLFAGSPQGAKRIAVMYTLTGTCKKLGIDPQKYIEHLLRELPKRTINQIDDLLPWNYAAILNNTPQETTVPA